MGIALFTLGGMLAPFHQMVAWFARPQPRATRTASPRPAPVQVVQPARAAKVPRARVNARRPLRVVRVVDVTGASASAGRIFMSGRMADVCAELDRLAALEAGYAAAAAPAR
ncbi:MAG: hypothetical protein ABIU58_12405 [Ramlibacter sp.]